MTDLEKIQVIKEQEKALVFPKLDVETVTAIAKRVVEKFRAENAPGYVLASVNRCAVYTEALSGAMPDNADWVRRKGNTAMLFNKSSYQVCLEFRSQGKDLSTRGLPVHEYCLAGGAFPIKVGDLTVGFIAASGTTMEEEHQLIADTIAEYFGIKIPSIFD